MLASHPQIGDSATVGEVRTTPAGPPPEIAGDVLAVLVTVSNTRVDVWIADRYQGCGNTMLAARQVADRHLLGDVQWTSDKSTAVARPGRAAKSTAA